MNQQTRRQFFKTVAATCAGIAGASTVAPVVVRGRTGWENDVGGRWPKGSVVRGGEKPQIKLMKFGKPGNSKTIIVYDEFAQLRITAMKEFIRVHETELFGPGICLCPRN